MKLGLAPPPPGRSGVTPDPGGDVHGLLPDSSHDLARRQARGHSEGCSTPRPRGVSGLDSEDQMALPSGYTCAAVCGVGTRHHRQTGKHGTDYANRLA